jgi:hypothetical protein
VAFVVEDDGPLGSRERLEYPLRHFTGCLGEDAFVTGS